jgi:hypothetical protein
LIVKRPSISWHEIVCWPLTIERMIIYFPVSVGKAWRWKIMNGQNLHQLKRTQKQQLFTTLMKDLYGTLSFEKQDMNMKLLLFLTVQVAWVAQPLSAQVGSWFGIGIGCPWWLGDLDISIPHQGHLWLHLHIGAEIKEILNVLTLQN